MENGRTDLYHRASNYLAWRHTDSPARGGPSGPDVPMSIGSRPSNAATEETLAFYEETVLRALEETENALANYHAQQARLIKLNDQARESKRAADISRFRYREGVADFLSLLDAERTQLQAEDAVAESEKDVYVAVIALYKALGGVPS